MQQQYIQQTIIKPTQNKCNGEIERITKLKIYLSEDIESLYIKLKLLLENNFDIVYNDENANVSIIFNYDYTMILVTNNTDNKIIYMCPYYSPDILSRHDNNENSDEDENNNKDEDEDIKLNDNKNDENNNNNKDENIKSNDNKDEDGDIKLNDNNNNNKDENIKSNDNKDEDGDIKLNDNKNDENIKSDDNKDGDVKSNNNNKDEDIKSNDDSDENENNDINEFLNSRKMRILLDKGETVLNGDIQSMKIVNFLEKLYHLELTKFNVPVIDHFIEFIHKYKLEYLLYYFYNQRICSVKDLNKFMGDEIPDKIKKYIKEINKNYILDTMENVEILSEDNCIEIQQFLDEDLKYNCDDLLQFADEIELEDAIEKYRPEWVDMDENGNKIINNKYKSTIVCKRRFLIDYFMKYGLNNDINSLKIFHFGYYCDMCCNKHIYGIRYHLENSNYDLCSACFVKHLIITLFTPLNKDDINNIKNYRRWLISKNDENNISLFDDNYADKNFLI